MALSFPLYRPFNLDDERFRLNQPPNASPLQVYKDLFNSVQTGTNGNGLEILKSDIYTPENFKSLGLVAFFSREQIKQLLGSLPANATLRPGAVGLVAALGLEADELCLMLGPSDEVGRIIPQQNSFDKGAVLKWTFGAASTSGTTVDSKKYQDLRNNFMSDAQNTAALRYKGFEKLKLLTTSNAQFAVDADSIFQAIFDPSVNSTPPKVIAFHLIIRNDDFHPNLDITPANYLTLAISVNNTPTIAYSGRATPVYTVYNAHPK